jgi:hypothetical protein
VPKTIEANPDVAADDGQHGVVGGQRRLRHLQGLPVGGERLRMATSHVEDVAEVVEVLGHHGVLVPQVRARDL